MGNPLLALAATLGIVGLAGAPMVGATVAAVNGPASGGGGMHGGGGGGAHSGGGYLGGHSAGGYSGGGHFAGGHFSAGTRFNAGTRLGGGYRGGAYGGHPGYAASSRFLAHGGYVSHGRSGYRVVGYDSAGLARADTAPRAGHGARIALALGPRWGSAASAARVDGVLRADHTRPRPGHPWCPPGHHPKHAHVRIAYPTSAYLPESHPPMFCADITFLPPGQRPHSGCLTPIKMNARAR